MLNLTRKKGETIQVGSGENTVTIQIGKISGNRVSILIDAPKRIPIKRGELECKK